MLNFSKLKNQDLIVLLPVILLILIGLTTIFATTFFPKLEVGGDFKKQILFIVVGIAAYLVISCLETEWLKQPKFQLLVFAATMLSLIAVLILGDADGPKRWFALGGFNIQPSEFAKLSVIILSACLFSTKENMILPAIFNIRQRVTSSKLQTLLENKVLWSLAINAVAVAMIVFLILIQPSLGNALITLGLWVLLVTTLLQRPLSVFAYLIIFAIGANLTLQALNFTSLYTALSFEFKLGNIDLLLLVLSIIAVLVLFKQFKLNLAFTLGLFLAGLAALSIANFAWNNVLTEYQRDRVVSFVNPEEDPLGAQWQVNQSKIAIASGQIFGKGLLQGTQSNAGLLPYAHTDFIYAAFAEQFGFVGCTILITLLVALVSRVFTIAVSQQDNFGRLICIGIAIMFALNSIINIGMNLGIMPVTGVPLPFVSYGGSAILVNFIGLGLVQMIYSESGREGVKVEKLIST